MSYEPTGRFAVVLDGQLIGSLALARWIADESLPTPPVAITITRARLLLAHHRRLSPMTRRVLQLRVDDPNASINELAERAGLDHKVTQDGLRTALDLFCPLPENEPDIPADVATALRQAAELDDKQRKAAKRADVFARLFPPARPEAVPAATVAELRRLWVEVSQRGPGRSRDTAIAGCHLNIMLAETITQGHTAAAIARALQRPYQWVYDRSKRARHSAARLAKLMERDELDRGRAARRAARAAEVAVQRPEPPRLTGEEVAKLRALYAASQGARGRLSHENFDARMASHELTVELADLAAAGHRRIALAVALDVSVPAIDARLARTEHARDQLATMRRPKPPPKREPVKCLYLTEDEAAELRRRWQIAMDGLGTGPDTPANYSARLQHAQLVVELEELRDAGHRARDLAAALHAPLSTVKSAIVRADHARSRLAYLHSKEGRQRILEKKRAPYPWEPGGAYAPTE